MLDAVLTELCEQELIELRLDAVDDGLPRLLTLDGDELIEDGLTDCEVDVLVFELWVLSEDTLELLAVLLLLGDSEDAELSDTELTSDEALVAVDTELYVERLLLLSLVKDRLDTELLAVESVELLTSEEGVLPVLPWLLAVLVDDSVVRDVSLSHSVARMYGTAE